jgi:hypothetical protein
MEKKVYLLHAKLKKQAGELFESLTKSDSQSYFIDEYYRNAGYAYIRTALSYASAGSLEQARYFLQKSDSMFDNIDSAGTERNSLKSEVLNAIRKTTLFSK